MIDLILIGGFLHSLLRSLLRCFFFCLLDEGGNINHLNLIVEIEEGVLAELGELCHKPTADNRIARGLGQATVVFQELERLQEFIVVRQSFDELFHIVEGQVLKLITVELFTRGLGNILSGGLVGLV